ncbi:MAG: DUF433 domain-containing protein [Isosphaerales bacterium]
MNLPEFLTRGSNGEIRLTGHRIELYHVVQSYNEWHTAEMLHHEYPTLPLALIYNVLAFYWGNKAEVDSYAAEVEAEIDRQEAAFVPGPAQLRIRRLMAEKAALTRSQRDASIAELGGVPLNLPEFLTRHEKGEIRLTGHRIDLFHFVDFYNEGHCAELLLGLFPTLNLALIHKVIAFYLENKAEVDTYVAHCEAEIERHQATTPPAPTIEELKARLLAKDPVPTA